MVNTPYVLGIIIYLGSRVVCVILVTAHATVYIVNMYVCMLKFKFGIVLHK